MPGSSRFASSVTFSLQSLPTVLTLEVQLVLARFRCHLIIELDPILTTIFLNSSKHIMSNKSLQVAVDVDMNSVNDRCDESNCVSWGLKTVYPLIVVSTIAVFVCLLLILALLIPLFLNLKKKMKQTRDEIANKSTRTRSTTRTNSNTSVNRRQQNTSVPSYGSYDLYLVYLAIPDLILNITVLILCGCIVNQEVHNVNYIYAIVMGCSTANLYINCFVSYEILNLLRNSNNVTKSRPPSLMKVTIQSMVVYVFSIIIFVAYYYTRKAKIESYYTGDYERYDFLWKVHMSCMIIVGTIPIMYFCYVWITIWYQGYMKLSSVTAGMKELVRSFFF